MKRGFTLIELLAVIVILAIITLIATPIVLNIINDTKKSSILRSADFYIDALENEIMLENMKQGGNFNPNVCEITNGVVSCDGTEINLEVDGEVPTSGSITFENGKVTDVNLTYSSGTITQNNKGELVLNQGKTCSLTLDEDKDGVADAGDMITCSTESFHVISNDGETISMLAQYNLDVGYVYNDGTREYAAIENPTGIQKKESKGWISGSTERYGLTKFSTTDYWCLYDDYDSCTYIVDANYTSEGRSYPFAYGDYKDANGNQQNLIYPYVKAYEEYLIKEGITSVSATLISYEQLIDLGCDANYNDCTSSQYDWIYATSYWTGSVYDWMHGLWDVVSDGGLFDSWYDADTGSGVRPVVNISVNEL